MGADSDKKESRIEEMRAKNVDRILDFQAAEFLAQSSKTFDFDERTSTSTPYQREDRKQEEEEEPDETVGEELAEVEGDEGLAEVVKGCLCATLVTTLRGLTAPSRPDEGS